MIGYSFYQLQFLLSTSLGHVMAEKVVFTVKFTEISTYASKMGECLFGVNVAEVGVVALLEGLCASV